MSTTPPATATTPVTKPAIKPVTKPTETPPANTNPSVLGTFKDAFASVGNSMKGFLPSSTPAPATTGATPATTGATPGAATATHGGYKSRRSRFRKRKNKSKKRSKKQKHVRFRLQASRYKFGGGDLATNAFPLTSPIPSANAKYVGGRKSCRRTRKK